MCRPWSSTALLTRSSRTSTASRSRRTSPVPSSSRWRASVTSFLGRRWTRSSRRSSVTPRARGSSLGARQAADTDRRRHASRHPARGAAHRPRRVRQHARARGRSQRRRLARVARSGGDLRRRRRWRAFGLGGRARAGRSVDRRSPGDVRELAGAPIGSRPGARRGSGRVGGERRQPSASSSW